MTTADFIIGLFCRVDDQMLDASKHPQAKLYPSEVVTLALLSALKGVGNRAFYRWPKRDFGHPFPKLPERTRLFRLCNSASPLDGALHGRALAVFRFRACETKRWCKLVETFPA